MKKIIALTLSILYPQSSWGQMVSTREWTANVNGQAISIREVEARVSSGPANGYAGISQTVVSVNNKPVANGAAAIGSGVFQTSAGTPRVYTYSTPVPSADARSYMAYNATGRFDANSVQFEQQSLDRMLERHKAAQAQINRQAAIQQFERENQRAIERSIGDYHIKLQDANNQNLSAFGSLTGAISDTTSALLQNTQRIAAINALEGADWSLKSASYNPEAQQQLVNDLKVAVQSRNGNQAAEAATSLNSPLSSDIQANIRQQLSSELQANGVLTGPAIDESGFDRFSDPQLEHQRLETLNYLQSSTLVSPDMVTSNKGGYWASSAATLVAAAELAAAHGDLAKASELMNEARKIARFIAGSSQGGRLGLRTRADGTMEFDPNSRNRIGSLYGASDAGSKIYSAALNEYTRQLGLTPQARPNVNPEFDRLAGNMGALADFAAASSNPINRAFGGFAGKLLDESQYSFQGGDTESGKLYLQLATVALDVTIGFIPGVGFARDCYELTTGYNLLTGEKLSGWERGFAALGVVTGGIGLASAGKNLIKGLKAGRMLSTVERLQVQEAIKFGEKIVERSAELKKIPGSGRFVKPLPELKTLKNGSSYAEAFEGAIEHVKVSKGDILVQYQPLERKEWGQWFGIKKAANVAEVDVLYNTVKWGNSGEQSRVFVAIEDFMAYGGRVKGGTGYQLFAPKSEVPYSEIFEVIERGATGR